MSEADIVRVKREFAETLQQLDKIENLLNEFESLYKGYLKKVEEMYDEIIETINRAKHEGLI